MGGKEIVMLTKTRDFNAVQCMLWMRSFNPGKIDVCTHKNYPRYLISYVPINQLQFPEGWYYSKESKTINNSNSIITVRIIVKE